MPIVRQVSASISLTSSPKDVFAAVTDWESQHKWIFATHTRGVGQESKQLGGQIEAFTGNVVKGKGLFTVNRSGDQTCFTWTEFVETPLGVIGGLGWYMVMPFVRLGMQLSMRRFLKRITDG